jgi:hypothetical protein
MNLYHENELYLYGKSIDSGEWSKLTLCRTPYERDSRYEYFRSQGAYNDFKWDLT